MLVPIVGNTQTKPSVHVYDSTNHNVLYYRDAGAATEYPASCCKLMTMFLAREHHNDDWLVGTVTITPADVQMPIGGLTVAGFQVGDVVTWSSLGYGLMLPSGADACQAIARVIGDEIWEEYGHTGARGVERFVQRMNARANELGLFATTFTNVYGGSRIGSTPGCVSCAADLTALLIEVFDDEVTREIAAATMQVLSTGARSFTVVNTNRLINGPTMNPSGGREPRIVGGKNGIWTNNGRTYCNMVVLYRAPAGQEIAIAVLGAESEWALMLDVKGLIYQMLNDYPELTQSTEPDPDPYWANVRCLLDAGVDVSAAHRAVALDHVGIGSPLISPAGALVINESGTGPDIADGLDLGIGSGDFTAETYFAGNGAPPPGNEFIFFYKADENANREYAVNCYSRYIQIFASSGGGGSGWTSTPAYIATQAECETLFNGAPRHLALVKHGSTWSLWINGERLPGTLNFGAPYHSLAGLKLGWHSIARFDETRVTMGVARYQGSMVAIDGRPWPRS